MVIDAATIVAMAWARQQYPYTFPIIGGVKIDQLKSNVEVSHYIETGGDVN